MSRLLAVALAFSFFFTQTIATEPNYADQALVKAIQAGEPDKVRQALNDGGNPLRTSWCLTGEFDDPCTLITYLAGVRFNGPYRKPPRHGKKLLTKAVIEEISGILLKWEASQPWMNQKTIVQKPTNACPNCKLEFIYCSPEKKIDHAIRLLDNGGNELFSTEIRTCSKLTGDGEALVGTNAGPGWMTYKTDVLSGCCQNCCVTTHVAVSKKPKWKEVVRMNKDYLSCKVTRDLIRVQCEWGSIGTSEKYTGEARLSEIETMSMSEISKLFDKNSKKVSK